MKTLLSISRALDTSVTHHKRKRVIQVLSISAFFLMLAILLPVNIVAAHASPNSPISVSVTNPYSPAYQHTYRHGVVPTTTQLNKIKSYQPAKVSPVKKNILSYGGGIDGVGVTSGTPKVYLVFWGTQWGTASTDSNSNLTFSNDSAGGAPYVQNLFKGLGTNNELWSGTMTQYCDGPGVSSGATTCSSTTMHVGYPTGGALAGVWYDNAASEPDPATSDQLANEANNAATHFGNVTPVSNRYAQYVIMSATGTNPDNYQTNGFCAWHDYKGNNLPNGDIAFTNLPYLPDVGSDCGQNFVNAGSKGTLDGYSIVEGHEYAETISDQNPAGGWTNLATQSENGDECAWVKPGQQGGAGNVNTSSGAFAMQSTWSNDTNRCDLSHAIVGNGTTTNDFSIAANPASMTIAPGSSSISTISTVVTSGSAAPLSLVASVSPSGPIASLSLASLTAGNPSTLTVNVGSSVAPGVYTVTVNGTEGSTTHSTSVTITVTSTGGAGITNGDFETGTLSGWNTSGTTSISSTAHSGTYSGEVGASLATNGDSSIGQTFTVPNQKTRLSLWYQISCSGSKKQDWATATLKDNTSGKSITILPKTCYTTLWWDNASARVIAGHSYTLSLVSHDGNTLPTYALFDDVTLNR
jgi:hypothetical protein